MGERIINHLRPTKELHARAIAVRDSAMISQANGEMDIARRLHLLAARLDEEASYNPVKSKSGINRALMCALHSAFSYAMAGYDYDAVRMTERFARDKSTLDLSPRRYEQAMLVRMLAKARLAKDIHKGK